MLFRSCRSGILAKSSCSESPNTRDSTTIRPSLPRMGSPPAGVTGGSPTDRSRGEGRRERERDRNKEREKEKRKKLALEKRNQSSRVMCSFKKTHYCLAQELPPLGPSWLAFVSPGLALGSALPALTWLLFLTHLCSWRS